MPLVAGDRIGPYEILAPLGAGGMGEVYRARDSKLKRDVALKVLPAAFSGDPDRMARFQREAEVLASLNHPNIAQLFGIEGSALVMELVEGDSPKGPMHFDEAWRIASQVAAALEYAHDKSIVHRDLKPANVKVDPEGVVKLLDFGLAKVFVGPEARAANPEESSTLTMGATQVGAIVGTPAYMAPEQAKSERVDKRADIWAFGVLLYELLTGERLFKGTDPTDTLVQVLTKQPDFDRAPSKAGRLLRECLEKDPKQRLRDIGDAKRLLSDDIVSSTAARSPSPIGLAGWLAAGVLFLFSAGISLVHFRERPPEHALTQFSVDLGPDAVVGPRATVAISRDGRRIVFPTQGGLATRTLDQMNATPISGTTGAQDPFFSPDGRWIAFFADGKLKKVAVDNGSVVTLCDGLSDRGGDWGDDGYIVFQPSASVNQPLLRISEEGGTPQAVTKMEHEDVTHRWPQVLPGAEALLFTSASQPANYDTANVDALSLQSGQRKTLVRGGYYGRYVPAEKGGYLVYIREGTLFAVPFDAERLEVRGTAVPVIDGVASSTGDGSAQFDISQTGVLVYRSGNSGKGQTMAWVDSAGRTTPLITKPGLLKPRFSPDGTRVAYHRPGNKARDIWEYDIERATHTQITFTSTGTTSMAWTPDGKHLVYGSGSPPYNLWWIRADGSGQPQSLLESKNPLSPESFTPDGRRVAFVESNHDIFFLPLDLSDPEQPKPGKPELFLSTVAAEGEVAVSPDGRWVAYQSNESGRTDVFVGAFQGPGGKWQISADGGMYPVWSRNRREILFVSLDGHVMVSEYTTEDGSFHAGRARAWTSTLIQSPVFAPFDLQPNGERLLALLKPEEDRFGRSLHAMFLLNFTDELRRRVAAAR